jgi:hypothetical protein
MLQVRNKRFSLGKARAKSIFGIPFSNYAMFDDFSLNAEIAKKSLAQLRIMQSDKRTDK